MKSLWYVLAGSLLCLALPAQDREIEKEGDQGERQEWFYRERAYPLGYIPTGARLNAVRQLDRMDRAARARRLSLRAGAATAAGANAADAGAWTSIGPRPTNGGSTYVTAGRVNAIAVDPRDSHVVYIGAAEGGVWKSIDGGGTWKPLTDDQPSLATGAIALDPSNPDTVYVGTGEENFSYDSYYGAGILKSTDGGTTWTNLASTVFLRARIGFLAVNPADSQVLLCTTDTGVWRSSDGAATWTNTLSGAAGTSVLFDGKNPGVAYAALGSTSGATRNGAYRSTDGGLTWRPMMGSGANALPVANVGRVEIALAPSSPSTLYAAIQNSDSKNFGVLLGIYKTVDSGVTWNQLTSAPSGFCAKQCWYDMALRVHPSNPDIIFGGGFQIVRSMDGGATWTTLPLIGPNKTQLHVDEHYLAFSADAAKLYIANDGGMYSTTDIDAASVNWTDLNNTLAITQFSPGLSVHPSDPNIAFGGTQDNGTQRFSGTPSWQNVTCGDGGFALVDSSSPSTIFSSCQNIDLRRTLDGGATWINARYGIDQNDRTQFISPFALDPSIARILYFGTYRLWQSTDGGGKWAPISPDLTGNTGTIKTIAVAPSDSNVIYVGTSNGRVEVTTNAGTRTGAIWNDRGSGLPNRTITHIAVDPFDSGTAYVTFSGFAVGTAAAGHVYRTADGGASWSDISGDLPNLPVNDVVVDPDLPDTLYIATDAGVRATYDAGKTWSSLGDGLPRVVVTSIALQRSSRTLFAATHGRSVWTIGAPAASAFSQPVIRQLAPATVNAGGGDFTLQVTGANFVSGVVIRWNGQDRPTTIIDASHIVAQIGADDIAHVGSATVLAFSNARGGGASTPVSFQIGPAPQSGPTAFVSAANPTGGSALAPRSIASLYGTNLASDTIVADAAPPLPLFLSGTTLTIANTAVPLFFVSPNQINFQVPAFILTGRASAPLTIRQGNLVTTFIVTLAPYSPALFTTNAQGTGQASALIAGTGIIAAPAAAFPGSRPARRGEFVSFYGTGLGDVTHGPAQGGPSPSDPLAQTLTTPGVTIGGAVAEVSFSGLAPGFVGLYQINVKIPDTAASGNAVPVVLSIGGANSNTATIAIQ